MDKKAGPKNTIISPLVRGIVPSHNNPMEQPNKIAVSVVGGISKNKIIEIHGSAIEAACLECEAKQNILDFHDAIKSKTPLPKCSVCGGVVKVATISFGQPMNEIDMMHASKIVEESDVMIVMGSSLKVLPAGKLHYLAMQSG